MKLSQHVRGLHAVIGESAADDIAADIEELESKLDEVSKELAATKGGPISCEAHGWSGDDECAYCQVTDAAAGRAYAEGVAEAAMERWEAAEERAKALESRLGTVEQLLRDTMRPHGSCTEGSCTHCDATSALADMARALVGEKRPHIDIPAPDCPCTGCEVLRRDAAVEKHTRLADEECDALFYPAGEFVIQRCNLRAGHDGDHARLPE